MELDSVSSAVGLSDSSSTSADGVLALDWPGCLERVRRRDQQAARELVERLYPLVISIIRNHLPRRTAEEDLAQDIFLKVFTRLEQYRGSVPFPHWVSRLALTTCIDQLRARKRRPELRWADLSEAEADVLDVVLTRETDRAPNDTLAARDLVSTLVERLDPDEQLIVRLFYLEQKSIGEIARLTGWNGNLIKVRAFRIRKKLRRIFLQLQESEHPRSRAPLFGLGLVLESATA